MQAEPELASRPPEARVEPASRAGSIADELREQILTGRFRPGDRLPSERDLVTRTGANRSSVREALKKLEMLGLIEIRRGGGARVVPIEQASLDVVKHLAMRDGEPDPAMIGQWLDVQEILTSGSVRLAVERADDALIERARALVRGLGEGPFDEQRLHDTLEELRTLVSAGTQNLLLEILRRRLQDLFHESYPGRGRRLRMPPGSQAAFQSLDAALVARDGRAVQEGVVALLRLRRAWILARLRARTAR
jgi:GntR family transcriptional repressor for pyruvate dehydrogenase complex